MHSCFRGYTAVEDGLVEWLQHVREGPIGRLSALAARHRVSESEMNAQVNAGFNEIVRDVRETGVRARRCRPLIANGGRDKRHVVGTEEVLEAS